MSDIRFRYKVEQTAKTLKDGFTTADISKGLRDENNQLEDTVVLDLKISYHLNNFCSKHKTRNGRVFWTVTTQR